MRYRTSVRASHRGPSFFLPLSCGATLLAYGIMGIGPGRANMHASALATRTNPWKDRLPTPQTRPGGIALHPEPIQRLDRLENEMGATRFTATFA